MFCRFHGPFLKRYAYLAIKITLSLLAELGKESPSNVRGMFLPAMPPTMTRGNEAATRALSLSSCRPLVPLQRLKISNLFSFMQFFLLNVRFRCSLKLFAFQERWEESNLFSFRWNRRYNSCGRNSWSQTCDSFHGGESSISCGQISSPRAAATKVSS